MAWEAVAVGAVAVLVAAALLWSGSSGGGHGTLGSSIPYSDARSLGGAAANGYLPGPWVVVGAMGLDERTGTTVSEANLTSLMGSNCTLTPIVGAGSSLVVPAYSGSFSAGVAPLWAVLFGESGGPVLLVLVLNATAHAAATLSGSACSTGVASHALPNDTADSPVAAAAAWSYAGQSWAGAAGSSVQGMVMLALGGGTFEGTSYGASWITAYVPCDPLVGGTVATPADVVVALLSSGLPLLSATHDVDCPA